jgi:hypothetical protein
MAGYRSIRLRVFVNPADVVVLVGDLRLLLAELLENAASFSAPGSMVDVEARLDGDGVITIVDHGIGMTSSQLADENRRLIERERLDVAPTSVLGLFVVGRLARRPGLGVRLDPTPGQGVTATVTVPRRLLVTVPMAGSAWPPGPGTPPGAAGPDRTLGTLAAALSQPPGDFAWFTHTAGRKPLLELPAAPPPPDERRGPLRTESAVKGPPPKNPAAAPLVPPSTLEWPPPAAVPPEPFVAEPAAPALAEPVVAQPVVVEAVVAQPIVAVPVPESTADRATRAGLTRRTPGQHLPDLIPSLRETPKVKRRNPDAERAELDDFLDGIERARPTTPDTGDPA